MSSECYKQNCIYHNKIDPTCDEKICKEKIMLSENKFVWAMKEIQKNHEEIAKFGSLLDKYFDSFIFSFGYDLVTTSINILKECVNDTEDDSWIDWFIYENDFGNRKMEAGYNNKTKQIKNASDLYRLIVEKNKK